MRTNYADNQTYESREEATGREHLFREVCGAAALPAGEGGNDPRRGCGSSESYRNDVLSLGIWGEFPQSRFTSRNRQSLEYQGSDADARSLEKEFSTKFTIFVNALFTNCVNVLYCTP